MAIYANAFVDNVHIAGNIARSLLKVAVDDHDAQTGRKRGGPYTIEDVDDQAAAQLDAALNRMTNATKEIRRFRDSVHHADERINYMAKGKRIETGGPALQMGCFSWSPLVVSSTVIDDDPRNDPVRGKSAPKAESYAGYVARIELTRGNLEVYAAAIHEVFTSLPWEPEPSSRGLHFGDDGGSS